MIVNESEQMALVKARGRNQMSNPKFGKHPELQANFNGNSRKKVVSSAEQSAASAIEHSPDAEVSYEILIEIRHSASDAESSTPRYASGVLGVATLERR